jgi:cytochrome P450
LLIIMRQLGVPEADLDLAIEFNAAFAVQYSQVASEDEEVAAACKIVEFQHYFADVIRRKRTHPSEDIISDMANATLADEGDDSGLSIPEILSIIQQLLAAGNETTASSLTEGMVYLLERPQLAEQIRASGEVPSTLVDEMLRLHSPVQSMWRVAARDTVLGGVPIEKGALVLLRFGAANRDETVFDDPDTLRLDRTNLKKSVAFGHGIHFCIGAALARREMTIGFAKLLTRIGGWRMAGEISRHRTSLLLRGRNRLDLEFDPAV